MARRIVYFTSPDSVEMLQEALGPTARVLPVNHLAPGIAMRAEERELVDEEGTDG